MTINGEDDPAEPEPIDVLRAILHINKEDAEQARERSPATRRKRAPRPDKPDDEPRD